MGCSDPAAMPPPAAKLPSDLLVNVLLRVDLPSKLAAACVCREWRRTCLEPTLWSSIEVPPDKAFRLWDSEFESLVSRCGGRLSSLHVSGSGITGKSLIRLLQVHALAPEVRELRLDHCPNLKLCDVLAFVHAVCGPSPGPLAPTRPTNSSSSSRGTRSQGIGDWDLEDYLAPSPRGEGIPAPLALREVVPPPPPVSRIARLHVDGCKQMGAWEVQQLQQAVGRLDVSVCSCSRIGVLQRCTPGPASLSVGAAASLSSSGTVGSVEPPKGGGARECPGLCPACAEVFKGCGESVCGACWEASAAPQVHVHALRSRLRLWQARREAMTVLRSRWTDFRYGAEVRPIPGHV